MQGLRTSCHVVAWLASLRATRLRPHIRAARTLAGLGSPSFGEGEKRAQKAGSPLELQHFLEILRRDAARSSSHEDLALDDLVGWLAADHRFSGKLLFAVRTPELPVRVVFDNPVLVALNEVTRPFFVVLVQKLAAVCTVNLYCMSFSHVSYQYVVRMLCSTGVRASSPASCDSVKLRAKLADPTKRRSTLWRRPSRLEERSERGIFLLHKNRGLHPCFSSSCLLLRAAHLSWALPFSLSPLQNATSDYGNPSSKRREVSL